MNRDADQLRWNMIQHRRRMAEMAAVDEACRRYEAKHLARRADLRTFLRWIDPTKQVVSKVGESDR